MSMQIPSYRAKKIDSDEYVIGFLKYTERYDRYSINPSDEFNTWYSIDLSTLSIHFSDMLDSQGNKIFASLNKDGKGGDRVEYMLDRSKKAISVCRYKDKEIVYAQGEVKVIGIQQ